MLRIQVPDADADADVYVDGNYVGQISALGDEPVGPVLLAPGVHRVEVRKPGRFPVQRTVRVDGDTPAETVLDAELLEDPQ
ncbi:MAG: PEGA domain-containing protein [Myxococcota bacterium]